MILAENMIKPAPDKEDTGKQVPEKTDKKSTLFWIILCVMVYASTCISLHCSVFTRVNIRFASDIVRPIAGLIFGFVSLFSSFIEKPKAPKLIKWLMGINGIIAMLAIFCAFFILFASLA